MLRRGTRIAVAAAVAAAVISAAAGPASAHTSAGGQALRTISPLSINQLFGVSAVSPSNAWAVGLNFSGPGFKAHALTEHWNGKAWTPVTSPSLPGASDVQLNGVAAPSPSDAWAAGWTKTGAGARTLIERWNGRAWKIQPSPNPGTNSDFIQAVAATSGTDAWSVGYYANSLADEHPLTEHWNGKTWTRVASPTPAGPSSLAGLSGVAATSAASAWAVGSYGIPGSLGLLTLTEHWNGKAWNLVPSPNPAGSSNWNELNAVAVTSATNAWAVGMLTNPATGARRTMIEHWNGRTWLQTPSPSPGTDSLLSGVTATSPANAWAVGAYDTSAGQGLTLIEHWNGRTWKQVASPSPGGANPSGLQAVTATSPASAWAVGYYIKRTTIIAPATLIEHWNGRSWKQVASPNP